MSLLVPAYPGCPGSKAIKRSLLVVKFICTAAACHLSDGHQLAGAQASLRDCMYSINQLPLADVERSDSRLSIVELTEVTVRLQSVLVSFHQLCVTWQMVKVD